MGYLYRYIDSSDNIIKYIGIIYSDRSVEKRIQEHQKNDNWCKKARWIIEYVSMPNASRTTLEALEAHLIAQYQTDAYYNKAKSGWGTCDFFTNIELEWKPYERDKKRANNQYNNKCQKEDTSFIKINQEYFDSFVKRLIPKDLGSNGIYQNNGVIKITKKDNTNLYTYVNNILWGES